MKLVDPMNPAYCQNCGTSLAPLNPGGLCEKCLANLAAETLAFGAEEGPDELPELAGRLELQKQIGMGGFGVVWSAKQQTGIFEREVAVKIYKSDGPGGAVRARFDA